jgi:hypothetical protein
MTRTSRNFTAAIPFALLLASALTGCSNVSNPEEPGQSGLESKPTLSYLLEGDRIINPARTTTDFNCLGDAPDQVITQIKPDTMRFRIEGSTLTFFYAPEAANSGATVAHKAIYQRSGSGSGLEGTWKLTDQGYEIVTGALTAAEKSDYDSELKETKHQLDFSTVLMEFAGGKITNQLDLNTAGLFMARWNGTDPELQGDPESAKYFMTAQALDKKRVQLKGLKTGETVQITATSLGDVTYTSDNPAHARHFYDHDSRSCPNQHQPDWYAKFMSDNAKPAYGT